MPQGAVAVLIESLFEHKIDRRIEEVIKVDQGDEAIVRDELKEYVVTKSLGRHFAEILERYWETPKKPHEGVGIWVSGFFGSGKSSFAKYLGYGLANRTLMGESAGEILGRQTNDHRVQVLLNQIREQLPTEAVIFDVSTDRGIRAGNQTLTEITYRVLLRSLGYAQDLDLAELELTLEEQGRLQAFEAAYTEQYSTDWNLDKLKPAIALQRASATMHRLEPQTYPTADSWRAAAQSRADITPNLLAERCELLVKRRRPGRTLVFVVDEVGQFVARDIQKMLDLQAIIQALGRVGRGKIWMVVTSQEKLTELVGGLDDRRVELARLRDRFPLEVDLEPSDISEVTSRRLLAKTSAAEKTLQELLNQHRGRLGQNTRLTADNIRLPELTAQNFVDLYPLLPYQVELIINVVSGLRTQTGASKHVGGANRTIIKLAQQLLVHPEVGLAGKPLGALVRLDQVYDLVAGNIASEIRAKIDGIAGKVDHPLAQPVAKAICLLQFAKVAHRTAENLAAVLHPAVDADSRLPEIKEALEKLVKAGQVLLGDGGYRIPNPSEDDWERTRGALAARPGDLARRRADVLKDLWQPQPAHNLRDVRSFKAGLILNNQPLVEGEVNFHLTFADSGSDFDQEAAQARTRSQNDPHSLYWVVPLTEAVHREAEEVYRSDEMISRKARGAQGAEGNLVTEEKQRKLRHQEELRRLLKQAILSGALYFRGNDRSPAPGSADVGKAAAKALGEALPEVYPRFAEAAVRVTAKDLDALLITENLRGLPAVFMDLHLVKEQDGKPLFETESGPLAEILGLIQNRVSYGETASGRWLVEELDRSPFGWSMDLVRLLVVSLLRAGKLEATSKGQVLESALGLDARNTFPNNNLFRQASFRPKVGLEFQHVVEAYKHFKDTFGRDVAALDQTAVATALREELGRREADLADALALLERGGLPGQDLLRGALEPVRAIQRGREDQAILTFNGSYREIRDAMERARGLRDALTEPRQRDLQRAREALARYHGFLAHEPDLPESASTAAGRLEDLLKKETFYRELPAADENARTLEKEYADRHREALESRIRAYEEALERLRGLPDWQTLSPAQKAEVSAPLTERTVRENTASLAVPLLRSDTDACPTWLERAVEQAMRMVDGARLVTVRASAFFGGGIETEEQLEAALEGLRQECAEQIGAGRKVLVQ